MIQYCETQREQGCGQRSTPVNSRLNPQGALATHYLKENWLKLVDVELPTYRGGRIYEHARSMALCISAPIIINITAAWFEPWPDLN